MDRKRLAFVAGGVLAAVAVLLVAVLAGQSFIDPDRITSQGTDDGSSSTETTEPRSGRSSDEPPESDSVRADLVEFESEDGGFAISYPRGWERIETPPDSSVKLVATPDGQSSLQVRRVDDLGFSVGPGELEGMREYTRRTVESGEDVDVIAGPSRVELDGLPGYVYVYTFADPDTGDTGVHSHYFLFDGDTMFTLVFQALPEERYGELAPLFDTIAESFRTQ